MMEQREDRTTGRMDQDLRELVHQLAADLRALADRLTGSPPGSPEWIDQAMGDLFHVGEDFRLLKGEVAKRLVINDGAASGLFREHSDRRGLALWMLTGALQTTGEAHEDLALALEQLLPRRYWRQPVNERESDLGSAEAE